MDLDLIAKICATWNMYSLPTRALIGCSIIATVLTSGLWYFTHKQMDKDSRGPATTIITNTVTKNFTVSMETHNHYHIGDIVSPDASPAEGWVRKLQQGNRTTVESSTREELDFGTIETKTVAEISETGRITALFRFINILEGGSWDVNSSTVLRDAGGQEVPLVARFQAGQFSDRLQFADDIICVGLSSRQPNSDSKYLDSLSYERALTLGRAVVQADVMHHPQTIYTLHLGGTKIANPLGSPSEPGQRAAVVIGVQRLNKDAVLTTDIADVVARAELSATSLTDYLGASEAAKRLRLGAPIIFQAPSAVGATLTAPANKRSGE